MFNWMSERGKGTWIMMIFLFTTFMPTALPGIYIMSELNPFVGLLYLILSFSIILLLWLRHFDKKEKRQKG